jgi:hypothetical protein
MKTSSSNDPFMTAIREILVGSGATDGRDDFKSKIFAEVQDYSTELQEAENASDLFFRLTELIVDCQSLSIPDNSFKVMVAYLLCESKDSGCNSDEEIRDLLGMDTACFEAAKESFKTRQCILSSLNREKTSRKGAMMAGKGNVGQSSES